MCCTEFVRRSPTTVLTDQHCWLGEPRILLSYSPNFVTCIWKIVTWKSVQQDSYCPSRKHGHFTEDLLRDRKRISEIACSEKSNTNKWDVCHTILHFEGSIITFNSLLLLLAAGLRFLQILFPLAVYRSGLLQLRFSENCIYQAWYAVVHSVTYLLVLFPTPVSL